MLAYHWKGPAVLAALGVAGACHWPMGSDMDRGSTIVTSVSPPGGATGVATDGRIEIVFSSAMAPGAETYVAVHAGDDATGPAVPGAWSWSADGMRLTFGPAAPLASGAAYAIHLGGGMRDAAGGSINYESCVSRHGGQMVRSGNLVGQGGCHSGGSYGAVFSFVTG